MGFCIGGPFIWSLLKRAPNRIPAAVLAQAGGLASGDAATLPTQAYFWKSWGPALLAKRPEDPTTQTTRPICDQDVRNQSPDFVFTVTRDFVRNCQNPILILPDDVPAHPYAVAMECAMLRAERQK